MFGISVAADEPGQLLEQMLARASARQRTTVFYVNAHVLNLSISDSAFRALLARADIVLADGYGARLAARWLRQPEPERMAITDWIWDLAARSEAAGLSLFFLAGSPGVGERAREKLLEAFPALKIVGIHHGYVVGDANRNAEALKAISASKPDILCVGMGSPAQERWIDSNAHLLEVPLILAVGAVLDFVSGDVNRPRPKWMTDTGLEWIGRLLAEPRRMWRRYLIGNPQFIVRTLAERRRQTKKLRP